MSVQEIKTLLRRIGLTEYETKACLALIKLGKATAEEISYAGEIPLPRVYDTMNSLAKRGLITVSKTRPQTFTITDFKRFFDILKTDEKMKFDKKMDEIENVSSDFFKLVNSIEKVEQSDMKEDILSYTRRANVGEVWDDIQKGTKKEFLIFAGDLSWIGSRTAEIKKLIKKGVDYRILWSKKLKEVAPNVRKAMKLGIKLRCYNDPSNRLRAIISDGEILYIIRKNPKPGVSTKELKEGSKWSEDIADYSGVLIKSSVISKAFRDYFYLLWEKSLTAEDFLKKNK